MNLSILEHGPFAGLMEKMMSKTNDTSTVAALKDHRPLADSELDAVSGGYWNFGGFFALPLPAPNVTVNGGPLAFVAPLAARS
jgi:hypothetical protein